MFFSLKQLKPTEPHSEIHLLHSFLVVNNYFNFYVTNAMTDYTINWWNLNIQLYL